MSKTFDLRSFYENIKLPFEENQVGPGHIDVFRIQDLKLSNDRKPNLNRRSFFKVTMINGKNKLHFNDHKIEFEGTALVFTNPAIHYFWERGSEVSSGYICIFTASLFSGYGSLMDFPIIQFKDAAVVPLSAESVNLFTDLFEKMILEIQGDYSFKYDFVRNQLTAIFHEAQKIQFSKGNGNQLPVVSASRIAKQFVELLERQFPVELKYQVIKLRYPADFAAVMLIHVNHLNKALKEITGQTTVQLINARIIIEAQSLLIHTLWSISEIAFSLGFQEPNNFSTFFKSRTKVTPKEFRLQSAD